MLDVDVLQRTFSSQRRNLRVYTLLFVLWTCAVRLRLVVRLFCLMLVVRLFCLMVVVRLFCLMLVVRLFCLMAVVRLFFLGGFLVSAHVGFLKFAVRSTATESGTATFQGGVALRRQG